MRREKTGRPRRWLPRVRPFAGRRLPRELRAENVRLLAAALPGGLRDPGFEPLVERIDDSSFLPGNRVTPFFAGTDAFASMLASIDGAATEVLLEAYILRDDTTGQAFQAALSRAAARGAAVRVLADAFGSFETSGRFWEALEASGVQVRIFHPLLARFWDGAFRDHRKILVVDRRIGFTGGMNIGDEYGSSRRSTRRTKGLSWRDTQVRVEGPTAWEMAVVFNEGWTHAGGAPVELAPLAAPDLPGARILTLDTRPGRGIDEKASVLTAIVSAARRRVWITNSYFAPGRRAVHTLTEAVRRGVDVRLLLPGHSDLPLVRHAGHGTFGELLSRGVRVFEYQPAILHAKSLVADDRVAVVGSTNLDYRSFRFNAECNLMIFDEAANEALAGAFETDLAKSEEIRQPGWRRRPLPHRVGDSLARCLAPVL